MCHRELYTGARWADVNNAYNCRNDKVTDGELNMKRQSKYVDRRKFDFRKNYNVGSVFGRIFLKTAANGYLRVTHSYSRFSLGTNRDYSQLHRTSCSGFSRFFLYIFANLYCLYLENKTLFRKSGSVTLHHLSPSSFIQKREQICLAVSEIRRAN